ncbi:MAG: protein-export chaperone SecB [Rickettsiales bacterium]|nr:protein-export chaperone SecB [Rickettsiales bacterium]|tara:strand:- start:96 stop:569 length:474 start_codon:yes stop_codon:yes gene_type:complete
MSDNEVQNSEDQQGVGALPIEIATQYVKDMSFENPNAPEVYGKLQSPPQIAVNVNVEARRLKQENSYEVSLIINATAKDGDSAVFIAELTYAAVVLLGELPQDAIQPFLLIEVPRLLFPFARNIISDATRDGGFPPLMINPVDFVALYKAGMAKDAS